jgi:DNA-directed RNA polymerase subunit RPC12/RpoP
MDKSITAICRKCNKSAPAGEFRIDIDLKLMVCAGCFRQKHPQKVIKNVIEEQKPKDWDEVDELLATRAQVKEFSTIKIREIGETGKVKYQCTHCKYRFSYNTIKKTPYRCPYCDASLPLIKAVKQ